jgi:hypothetical protein
VPKDLSEVEMLINDLTRKDRRKLPGEPSSNSAAVLIRSLFVFSFVMTRKDVGKGRISANNSIEKTLKSKRKVEQENRKH